MFRPLRGEECQIHIIRNAYKMEVLLLWPLRKVQYHMPKKPSFSFFDIIITHIRSSSVPFLGTSIFFTLPLLFSKKIQTLFLKIWTSPWRFHNPCASGICLIWIMVLYGSPNAGRQCQAYGPLNWTMDWQLTQGDCCLKNTGKTAVRGECARHIKRCKEVLQETPWGIEERKRWRKPQILRLSKSF